MSLELAAILVTSLLELAGLAIMGRQLVIMGRQLVRMWDKTEADDAARYLQGRRVEDVLREMRAELLRR